MYPTSNATDLFQGRHVVKHKVFPCNKFFTTIAKIQDKHGKNSMKNGVFSCGESKRLLKEVSLVKGQLTVVKIQNIGFFLTLIYPKCTTAKSKSAVKATALVKNER